MTQQNKILRNEKGQFIKYCFYNCSNCNKELKSKKKTGLCRTCYVSSALWKERCNRISISHKQLGVGKWMKGRKISAEAIAKRVAKMKGRKRPPFSEEWKRKIGLASKGRKWTPEQREKTLRVRTPIIKSQSYREMMSRIKTGFKHTEANKQLFSIQKMGDKNPMWKNNATERNWGLRLTSKYKKWQIAIFKRDAYTCQTCGFTGKNTYKNIVIHADHIKSFTAYPELRYDINNGRTLCVPCHRKTATWGIRGGLRI